MNTIISLLLVLRFDGSLRPPRDFGFPTNKLRRLASCSASIFWNEEVIAIGGKYIPINPGITSADVEFEGLLLGLEYIKEQKLKKVDENILVIEGDCKSVIDQVSGKVIPRRLEMKCEDAISYLEQIGFNEVKYCHIPRTENTLCDSVCGEVINLSVKRTVRQLRSDLKNEMITIEESILKYFDIASIIPFSERLDLYAEILECGRIRKDNNGILRLGRQLEFDAKLWPKCDNKNAKLCREKLRSLAIWLQIEVAEAMGNVKEALKLRRKNRYILDRYSKLEDSLSGEKTVVLDKERNDKVETSDFSDSLLKWRDKASEDFYHRSSIRYSGWQFWLD